MVSTQSYSASRDTVNREKRRRELLITAADSLFEYVVRRRPTSSEINRMLSPLWEGEDGIDCEDGDGLIDRIRQVAYSSLMDERYPSDECHPSERLKTAVSSLFEYVAHRAPTEKEVIRMTRPFLLDLVLSEHRGNTSEKSIYLEYAGMNKARFTDGITRTSFMTVLEHNSCIFTSDYTFGSLVLLGDQSLWDVDWVQEFDETPRVETFTMIRDNKPQRLPVQAVMDANVDGGRSEASIYRHAPGGSLFK